MRSNLTKVSLALLSAVFVLGCQDLGLDAVGPGDVGPQFAKGGGGGGKTLGEYSVVFMGDITGGGTATKNITAGGFNLRAALTIPITEEQFNCFGNPDDPPTDPTDPYTLTRTRGFLQIGAGNRKNKRPPDEAKVEYGIHDFNGSWVPYTFVTFGDIQGENWLPTVVGTSSTVTGTDVAWTLENSGGKKNVACPRGEGTVTFTATVTLVDITD